VILVTGGCRRGTGVCGRATMKASGLRRRAKGWRAAEGRADAPPLPAPSHRRRSRPHRPALHRPRHQGAAPAAPGGAIETPAAGPLTARPPLEPTPPPPPVQIWRDADAKGEERDGAMWYSTYNFFIEVGEGEVRNAAVKAAGWGARRGASSRLRAHGWPSAALTPHPPTHPTPSPLRCGTSTATWRPPSTPRSASRPTRTTWAVARCRWGGRVQGAGGQELYGRRRAAGGARGGAAARAGRAAVGTPLGAARALTASPACAAPAAPPRLRAPPLAPPRHNAPRNPATPPAGLRLGHGQAQARRRRGQRAAADVFEPRHVDGQRGAVRRVIPVPHKGGWALGGGV
jgi:hypothetical protein